MLWISVERFREIYLTMSSRHGWTAVEPPFLIHIQQNCVLIWRRLAGSRTRDAVDHVMVDWSLKVAAATPARKSECHMLTVAGVPQTPMPSGRSVDSCPIFRS